MDFLLKSTTAVIITSGVAGMGLEAYGLPIFLTLMFGLFIFSGLDIVYGYYLAHRRKIVTSSILADGMMRKLFFILLSGLRGVFCYAVGNVIHSERSMLLSFFACLPAAGFLYAQMSSLVENLGVGAKNDEKRLIELLMKIFGIGKRRLETKIQKYSDIPASEVLLPKPPIL